MGIFETAVDALETAVDHLWDDVEEMTADEKHARTVLLELCRDLVEDVYEQGFDEETFD